MQIIDTRNLKKMPKTLSFIHRNSLRLELSCKDGEKIGSFQKVAKIWSLYPTLSSCDLDLWPVDLELSQHLGCHTFNLCTKFERNRVIHDLALFACSFRGWFRTDRAFSGVREPNFTKLGQDIGQSSQHCTFVSEFGYLAAFSTALIWVMFQTTPNFALFDPSEN